MAPPKKRKVVKHLKKNWKKHSDIQDVEDFLEDKRLQERTGGIVADKQDDQLFFLDAAPVVKKKPEAPQNDVVDAAGKLVKKRKINEPARCYANLLPDPRVTVPNTEQKGELGKKKKTKKLPAGEEFMSSSLMTTDDYRFCGTCVFPLCSW